jgi:adenine-specific DNA methylase
MTQHSQRRLRPQELPLIAEFSAPTPPQTRFQGSKYKLLEWIWDNVQPLRFTTVLDAFGGSGCVSHFLKGKGKQVTYNDTMRSFYLSALAFVVNDRDRLTQADLQALEERDSAFSYGDFIRRTFKDIYFLDDENDWLDVVAQNIPRRLDNHHRALAYHAVFQSATAKRPYNLFHRKNLYMRLAEVERGFGNKASWDRPFGEHLRNHADEANRAVFQGEHPCHALNMDVLEVPAGFDLVYVDPPYLNSRGMGVDYHQFYHFLEGLTHYDEWPNEVDFRSKHRRLKPRKNAWNDPRRNLEAFQALFRKHSDSTLVVSYRSDGTPSAEDLARSLGAVKKHVDIRRLDNNYKYVLSTNASSTELLLIGTD